MTDDPEAPRGPTLADIARASGVAISTASRALSTPGRVSARTVERVQSVARDLGYRSPRDGRTPRASRTIAVLVSDVTNPFYFGMIRGTQHQLKAAGYTQLLVDTEESDELEENMLRTLHDSCDGAILTASRLRDDTLTELSRRIPLVTVNRDSPGIPNVLIDTPNGMLQALAHLRSLGHRSIVYAAGPSSSWIGEERWRALQLGAQHHGIEVHRAGPFMPRRESGAAAADEVLTSGATACIAFNDLLAIGILERLRERGARVPEDLSVVGCDDIFGADFCHPTLTTLTAPIEQAGQVAVSMLLGGIDSRVSSGLRRTATLPTHLTVRGSSGPAPEP
ncbi:LacI family DNA-binding transcriptional regulator [Pseudolysinimonas sp.]|uniref:LacI family DNA-binding transcriptional regulator n=1 Tax=Pseudolysinimonas sp. TaxID=2680009 RepID=UPI003F81517D